MKTIGKYVIIEAIKETTQTKGGLLLNDKLAKDIRYVKGVVKSVGCAVSDKIKEGDEIYYDRHAGFSLPVKSETFLVIKESDIVVVL
jgi:co-chaperonin GroES (HSP10)